MRSVMRFFPAITALFVVAGIVVIMHTITTEKLRTAYSKIQSYEQEIDVLKATNRDLELLTANVLKDGAEQVSVSSTSSTPTDESTRSCVPVPTSSSSALDTAQSIRNPATAWRNFGMSRHERECENVFGIDLLDIWRGKSEEHCSSSDNAEGSSLTCYRHHQLRHSGPDIMCVGRNVQFDFSKPRPANKASAFGEDGHFALPAGTLRAMCSKTPAFSLDKFPMSQKVRAVLLLLCSF